MSSFNINLFTFFISLLYLIGWFMYLSILVFYTNSDSTQFFFLFCVCLFLVNNLTQTSQEQACWTFNWWTLARKKMENNEIKAIIWELLNLDCVVDKWLLHTTEVIRIWWTFIESDLPAKMEMLFRFTLTDRYWKWHASWFWL